MYTLIIVLLSYAETLKPSRSSGLPLSVSQAQSIFRGTCSHALRPRERMITAPPEEKERENVCPAALGQQYRLSVDSIYSYYIVLGEMFSLRRDNKQDEECCAKNWKCKQISGHA